VLKRVLTTPPDRIRTDELLPIAEDLDKIQSYMTEKMGVMRSKININDLLELTFAKEAGAK